MRLSYLLGGVQLFPKEELKAAYFQTVADSSDGRQADRKGPLSFFLLLNVLQCSLCKFAA